MAWELIECVPAKEVAMTTLSTSNLRSAAVLLTLAGTMLAQGPPRGSSGGAVNSAPPATSAPASSYSAGSGPGIGASNMGRSMGSTGGTMRGTTAGRAVMPNGAPIRTVPSNVGTLRERKAGVPIVLPPAMERWSTREPCTEERWRRRDIMGQIMYMARSGSIPIRGLTDESELYDYGWIPAGWRAYGMFVPAGGEVRISLDHSKRAWFRLTMMNKWGQLEQGMLQNYLHTFEPVVTYKNPTDKTRAIYFIADDPAWWSHKDWPYKLTIQRNWDPKLGRPDTLKLVDGIWAVHTPDQPPANMAAFLGPESERERRMSAVRR
jgi:hypothetical protein